LNVRWIACIGITLVFAAGARAVRGTSPSGTIAGALVSLILCVCEGLGAFALLLSVFLLSFMATRIGRARKEELGTAEKRDGRKASQVLANLGIGTLAAVVYAAGDHNRLWLLATTAAFAEAAADTVSSEVGQAFHQDSRLITNLRPVPAGTDGGITVIGTLAGVCAAFVLGVVASASKLIPMAWVPVAGAAGIFGMFFDSLLGASFERKGWLKNDQVNFLSTVAAAFTAILWLRISA
jgi:uncharacterized protein (TIGR00297 family)